MILNLIQNQILDEGIPRELLNLYKNSEVVSDVHSIPYFSSSSAFSGFNRPRRSLHDDGSYSISAGGLRIPYYDFGKATYRKITSDEAKALIKRDKNEAKNLRIDIDGSLVMFEVRNNGSLYPIVRNPYKEVTIDGVTKRNAGYFSINKLLSAADNIWWTDEFNFPLAGSEKEANRKGNRKVSYYGHVPDNSADLPSYLPYDNFNKSVKFSQEIPDTGDHSLSNRFDGMRKIVYSTNPSLSAKVDSYFDAYLRYKELQKASFATYNRYRKALQKLERDRDEYSQADYESLKSAWESQLKNAKSELDSYSKAAKNSYKNFISNADSITTKMNERISNYLEKVQDALESLNALKEKINNEKAQLSLDKIKNTDLRRLEDDDPLFQIIEKYRVLNSELAGITQKIESDKINLDTISDINNNNIANISSENLTSSDYQEILNDFDEVTTGFESSIQQAVDLHIKELRKLENSYKNLKNDYDSLKPISAKKDLEKRIKSGARVSLDPELEQSNLIVFK